MARCVSMGEGDMVMNHKQVNKKGASGFIPKLPL